jgi:putative Mn2+ efflux pump MntP
MSYVEMFLIAISLSMDAFAVSVGKGLSMKKIKIKDAVIIGIWFGGFQGLMPVIGYLLGVQFQEKITTIDHWIAFTLLALIGANMIREAFSKEENQSNASVGVKTMFILAVATSIDALAIGVTFAFLQVHIIPAVITIGITTFVLSLVGIKIGNLFGIRYKAKAEIAGGVILILLGIKILLEHLGYIAF